MDRSPMISPYSMCQPPSADSVNVRVHEARLSLRGRQQDLRPLGEVQSIGGVRNQDSLTPEAAALRF